MPRPVLPPPPAVAALRSELPGGAVPTTLRLIPAGTFRAEDGSDRPADAPAWQLTDGDAKHLIAEMSRRKYARYIDYEHATLHAKANGAQAPAAGWFDRLEWHPDTGLWATGIDWTAPAARMIAHREYRYISPLFTYQPGTGRVLSLLGASLTNDPGLDGLTDLAALAAQTLNPTYQSQEHQPHETLKKLQAALGLAQSANESAALAAVSPQHKNVAALGAQAATLATPDPAKYAPVATLAALQAEHSKLQSQLAALTAKARAAELAQVIDAAKAAGKLTPALETWATDLGTRDLAALTAYLEAMPAILTPGTTQTGGKAPAGQAGIAALTADEQKVCRLIAVKPEDYLNTKTATA
jgi:phage I-like protein